jgi:hypothetical protein
MRNTTRFSLKLLVLAVVVSAASMTSRAADTLVYNNTSNYLGNSYYVASEFGDQITLSTSTTDRYLTKFMFEYTSAHGNDGNETAWLRFYRNDGLGGIPGSLFFDSRNLPGYATDIPLPRGNANQVEISGVTILVPNTFTWTVQFSNVAASETVGLTMYNPPTVGSNFDDYWEKSGTTWVAKRLPGYFYSFGALAYATAVPEPGTLQLGVLAGITALGFLFQRRMSKRS